MDRFLDLQAEAKQISQDELENIHRNKTGALIQAAIMMGAVTIFSGTDQRRTLFQNCANTDKQLDWLFRSRMIFWILRRVLKL